MEDLILLKNKLTDFINKIKSDYTIFAPIKKDELTYYSQIENPSDISLDFINSNYPPKSILFNQTETLFKFRHGLKAEISSKEIKNSKNVIFGIRPCDAKSFFIIDKLFREDYVDPYYNSKRENTVLIGLSCNLPGTNCFCTSMDGGPANAEDVDILFTDIGDKFYIEVKNKKGENLIKNGKNLFNKPKDQDKTKLKQIKKKAEETISRKMNTKGIVDKLENIFNNKIWKDISFKCIGCGICTYGCPTCHCFDILDETSLREGARVRVWDTCMNPEYTVHASGHNPRPARMNRTRNRVYHKFNYYPKNYNIIACVGCGRCINECPVNIDIIDVITKAREVKT